MSPLPSDPMTELAEAMTSLHEMYLSAIAAGFTKREAMTLTVRLALGSRTQPEDDR